MSVVYEKTSKKSFEEAIASVKENLKKEGFGVLWELDFKSTLEKKGLDFADDFVIMEVCDPLKAKEIMEENIRAGYVLPCKMAVRREKETIYIGLSSPESLLGLFDSDKLNTIAKEVETTLIKVIEASL